MEGVGGVDDHHWNCWSQSRHLARSALRKKMKGAVAAVAAALKDPLKIRSLCSSLKDKDLEGGTVEVHPSCRRREVVHLD